MSSCKFHAAAIFGSHLVVASWLCRCNQSAFRQRRDHDGNAGASAPDLPFTYIDEIGAMLSASCVRQTSGGSNPWQGTGGAEGPQITANGQKVFGLIRLRRSFERLPAVPAPEPRHRREVGEAEIAPVPTGESGAARPSRPLLRRGQSRAQTVRGRRLGPWPGVYVAGRRHRPPGYRVNRLRRF